MNKKLFLTLLVSTGMLGGMGVASAQVAGSSTIVGVTVEQMTQVANGWSVKKSILGKPVYSDAGAKIGVVEDLIISSGQNVTYLIVGAGGFIGMGRHDVAIAIGQIQENGDKIFMPGATLETIKAMPQFTYASDTAKRDYFIARAQADIVKGRTKIAELEKSASSMNADAKVKLDQQIVTMKADVKAAEAKLAEMNQAGLKRWKAFEIDVNASTANIRKWLATPAI
jgi:sporulation protein YlmC with PRC-barrel domain